MAQAGHRPLEIVGDVGGGLIGAFDETLELSQHGVDALGDLVEIVMGVLYRHAPIQVAARNGRQRVGDIVDPPLRAACEVDARSDAEHCGCEEAPAQASHQDAPGVLDLAVAHSDKELTLGDGRPDGVEVALRAAFAGKLGQTFSFEVAPTFEGGLGADVPGDDLSLGVENGENAVGVADRIHFIVDDRYQLFEAIAAVDGEKRVAGVQDARAHAVFQPVYEVHDQADEQCRHTGRDDQREGCGRANLGAAEKTTDCH